MSLWNSNKIATKVISTRGVAPSQGCAKLFGI
jgi:hypothetical protein